MVAKPISLPVLVGRARSAEVTPTIRTCSPLLARVSTCAVVWVA